MKCKFCNKEKKLIDAHIVPEAFFRELRTNTVSPVLVDDSPKSHSKRRPKGVFDKNLVCSECEKHWEQWDDYGIKFILKTNDRKNITVSGSVIADVTENINYAKLKLFFISMLWRASASDEEFYSKVNLGPFEEKCKEMIIDRDPGTDDDFSIIIARHPDPAGKIIVEPFPEKRFGLNYYRFSLAGHIAIIKVDSRKSTEEIKKLSLKKDHPLIIPYRDIYKDIEAELLLKTVGKVTFPPNS